MTIRALIGSVSRKEWRFVIIISIILMIITSVAPVVGFFIGWQRGEIWTGVQYFAPGDFAVYLASIEQSARGSLLIQNMFTTAPTEPYINILWWGVGKFSALFNIGYILAFHLVRVILIPILCGVIYLNVAYFLRDVRSRYLSSFILLFGGGLGVPFWLIIFNANETISTPIDLWVAESLIFTSVSYSPHFVASWILYLLIMLFLALAISSGRLRYGWLAGLLGAVLFQFHPFHFPVFLLVGLAGAIYYLFFSTIKKSAIILSYLIFCAVSVPLIAYHYVRLNSGLMSEVVSANYNPTPNLLYVALGFGLVFFLAPLGYIFFHKNSKKTDFLAIWAGSQLIAIYLPVVFQRRLIEGLYFPLVILAIPVLLWLYDKLAVIKNNLLKQIARIGLPIIFLMLVIPSSINAMLVNITLYQNDNQSIFYFDNDTSQAINWIRANTNKNDAFISSGNNGNIIAGWAGRKVFFGHWVESGNPDYKTEQVRKFFQDLNDFEKVVFMNEHNLSHIYLTENEGLFDTIQENKYFSAVFTSDSIHIYELK